MSGFAEKLIDTFTHRNSNDDQPSDSYAGGRQQDSVQQQLPYPWVSQWDEREQRNFYINEQTGERSWTFPSQGEGDAYVTREGEEMREGFDQSKDRFEQSAEDLPQDAAEWTGRRVGEAEEFPENVEQGFDRFGDGVERKFDGAVEDVQDAPENIEQGFDRFGEGVERKFDNAANDVEEAPENVAGWVGEQVGDAQKFGDDVEKYGDGLGDEYNQGRKERRYVD